MVWQNVLDGKFFERFLAVALVITTVTKSKYKLDAPGMHTVYASRLYPCAV